MLYYILYYIVLYYLVLLYIILYNITSERICAETNCIALYVIVLCCYNSVSYLQHLVFCEEITVALNHEHSAVSPRHDQIQLALLHLLHSRVHHKPYLRQQAHPYPRHSLLQGDVCTSKHKITR